MNSLLKAHAHRVQLTTCRCLYLRSACARTRTPSNTPSPSRIPSMALGGKPQLLPPPPGARAIHLYHAFTTRHQLGNHKIQKFSHFDRYLAPKDVELGLWTGSPPKLKQVTLEDVFRDHLRPGTLLVPSIERKNTGDVIDVTDEKWRHYTIRRLPIDRMYKPSNARRRYKATGAHEVRFTHAAPIAHIANLMLKAWHFSKAHEAIEFHVKVKKQRGWGQDEYAQAVNNPRDLHLRPDVLLRALPQSTTTVIPPFTDWSEDLGWVVRGVGEEGKLSPSPRITNILKRVIHTRELPKEVITMEAGVMSPLSEEPYEQSASEEEEGVLPLFEELDERAEEARFQKQRQRTAQRKEEKKFGREKKKEDRRNLKLRKEAEKIEYEREKKELQDEMRQLKYSLWEQQTAAFKRIQRVSPFVYPIVKRLSHPNASPEQLLHMSHYLNYTIPQLGRLAQEDPAIYAEVCATATVKETKKEIQDRIAEMMRKIGPWSDSAVRPPGAPLTHPFLLERGTQLYDPNKQCCFKCGEMVNDDALHVKYCTAPPSRLLPKWESDMLRSWVYDQKAIAGKQGRLLRPRTDEGTPTDRAIETRGEDWRDEDGSVDIDDFREGLQQESSVEVSEKDLSFEDGIRPNKLDVMPLVRRTNVRNTVWTAKSDGLIRRHLSGPPEDTEIAYPGLRETQDERLHLAQDFIRHRERTALEKKVVQSQHDELAALRRENDQLRKQLEATQQGTLPVGVLRRVRNRDFTPEELQSVDAPPERKSISALKTENGYITRSLVKSHQVEEVPPHTKGFTGVGDIKRSFEKQ